VIAYTASPTGVIAGLCLVPAVLVSYSEALKESFRSEKDTFAFSRKLRKRSLPEPGKTFFGKGPDFPREIQDEFRGLRWMPTQPKHLDYVNTQFLLIGESSGLEKATEVQVEDENKTDTPLEEMEKLEGEDEIRVKHLKGDDAIFSDLDLSKNDFPKVPSTWE